MNRGMKMLAVSSVRNGGQQNESGDSRRMNYDQRYGMENGLQSRYSGEERSSAYSNMNYPRNEYGGTEANYGGMESRFRDRRGREHYDDGRFAPMRNEYGAEMRKGDDRSMNQIGFNAGHEMGGEYRMSAGYDRMDELDYRHGGEKTGGYSMGEDVAPFDKETAQEWTRQMKNEDGTIGPHWTMEQTKQVMAQKSVSCDPWEFFAALNAMYSDYSKVFKKYGVGDKLDFYVDMAKAFIEDKDAQPGKLRRYYTYVVKH